MKKKLNHWMPVLICAVMILILILLPTGFEPMNQTIEQAEDRIAARVASVDNSTIKKTGVVQSGEQSCQVELLSGPHKGEEYTAINILSGSLEQDKIYEKGDKALVLVSFQNEKVVSVSMIDHYRIGGELILLFVFFAVLILFAGWTGLRAVLSFALAVLVIWKILIPSFLQGMNPLIVGTMITVIITLLTIGLVFGFDKRCLSACAGAGVGLILTALLGIFCTNWFNIHGAIMAFSESLLYSGYQHLDLTQIFMASIFIGSSGAMIDLAVDIAAATDEIAEQCPTLSRMELIASAVKVGKASMGTMITTLLLAYSGGYIALLMVFMAQGTPLINIFNYKYVASEIIQTLVGSLGLVSVAPLTAIFSGMFLSRLQKTSPVIFETLSDDVIEDDTDDMEDLWEEELETLG